MKKEVKSDNNDLSTIEKMITMGVVIVLMLVCVFLYNVFVLKDETEVQYNGCDSFSNPIPCPDTYNPSELMDEINNY